MLVELPDERLATVIPEDDYLRLKARVERAYANIERDASATVLKEVLELLLVLREVEMRLLEDRFRERYLAYPFDWRQRLPRKGTGA